MKTIEVTTGFLSEEFTLRSALKYKLMNSEQLLHDMKDKNNTKFIPNQHIIIADIRNCKLLLKKLEKEK